MSSLGQSVTEVWPGLKAIRDTAWRRREVVSSQLNSIELPLVNLPLEPYYSAATNSLVQTSWQRLAKPELLEVKSILIALDEQDALTPTLTIWRNNFSAALDAKGDAEEILQEYIRELRKLLRDSLTMAPLDETAIIGNGKTYNQETLDRCYRAVSTKDMDPIYLEQLIPLAAKPNDIVRKLVQWLNKIEALRSIGPRSETEELYDQIERLRLEKERRERQMAWQFGLRRTAFEKRIDTSFAAMSQMIREGKQAQAEQIAAVKEEFGQGAARLKEAIERLEHRVEVLEQQKVQLKEEVIELRRGVDQVKAENAELRRDLAETKEAVARANQDSAGNVFKALVIIGACLLANWAIQQSLSYLGSAIAA